MSEQKAVTVSQVAGTTVVVNNKRDGIKKFGLLFAGLFIAALAQTLKAAFPKWGPMVDIGLDAVSAVGLGGGTLAMTSPFDQRGVVLHNSGELTVDQSKVPVPPSSPSGPGGIGISVLLCAIGFASFGLTGCAGLRETIPQTPQACPVRYQKPVPLMPVATASKTLPVSKVVTVGLKNPGAQPGETFSAANGGASCQQRLTVDGWVTICPQPNDGDSFDVRNQDLYSKAPAMAGPMEREVTLAQPKVTEPMPVRPAAASPPDPAQVRLDLKARFPGLLGR